MTDLVARLAEALDRAERMAVVAQGLDVNLPASVMPWQAKTILRVIARDRVLLAVHYRMEPDHPERMLDELRDGWCSACLPPDVPGASMYAPWPCESMRLAAAFWLPEETR